MAPEIERICGKRLTDYFGTFVLQLTTGCLILVALSAVWAEVSALSGSLLLERRAAAAVQQTACNLRAPRLVLMVLGATLSGCSLTLPAVQSEL